MSSDNASNATTPTSNTESPPTLDGAATKHIPPPHLLLPPEILVDIFTFTCTIDSEDPFLRQTSPLTLGHVCGAWRAFAWSLPSLWGTVDLTLSTTKYYAQLELLTSWLERAQKTPLAIYIISPNQLDDYWASNPPHEVIRLLASHSWHWLSIDFSVPKRCYDDLLQVKDNLPLLTSASIRHPYLGRITRHLGVFQNCPLLQEIKVSQYYLADLTFPWQQLTRCTVDAFFVDECHTLLELCPNLTFCRFTGILVDSDGERFAVADVVDVPNLQTLEIVRAGGEEITEFLNTIRCPSLRRLQLDSSELMQSLHIETTMRVWGCHLESLAVQNAFITEKELLDCLRALPSLCQLQMVEPIIRDELSSEFMSLLSESYQFLPKLRELKHEGVIRFEGQDVFDALCNRWKLVTPESGASRLEDVTLTVPDTFVLEDRQRTELDIMRKEGLNCVLNFV